MRTRRAGRRRALNAIAALGAAGIGAALWRWWPDQGFVNPCRAGLPPGIAADPLVRAAWAGLDPAKVWDCHAHLAGTGDSASGIRVDPRMFSVVNPVMFAQRLAYLNAACTGDAPGTVDASYVERARDLLEAMPAGVKLMLYAMDCVVGESGAEVFDATSFYVPNRYAAEVARRHPERFEWVASVHPYRIDAAERIERAAAEGARALKWLPAAMGIDPASPRCDPAYRMLVRLDLPLVTHAGREMAIGTAAPQDFGNPLKLRRALGEGVRVVVAHCASLGRDIDIDRGASGPQAESFSLFARLMDDRRWERTLYADISGLTQLHRAVPALTRVIEREHWHARLLNGSDYPLPGVMPLYSVERLADLGLIERAATPVLHRIREHNPLLFDFVLKRSLRHDGRALPESVFETRGFFTRRA